MEQMPIKKLTGSRIPTRWMAVFWDGNSIELEQWVFERGEKRRKFSTKLGSGEEFWSHLWYQVHSQQCWWVVGWRMYEMLCWSNIYSQIQSDYWTCSVETKIANGQYVKEGKRRLFGCMIAENPPTIIDVARIQGGSVRFVDLGNYGMKPKHFLDVGEPESLETATQAIEDYLTAVKELEMGSLKTTAASQGWGCFRTKHMRHDLYPNQNKAVREMERASYYSGRAEAFRVGKLQERLYHLDVCGMYNSIGLEAEFPTRLLYTRSNESFSRDMLGSTPVQYIADVTIETDEPVYPLRYDGIVIYPVGRFRTTLANPELRYAISNRHIREVHKAACYESRRIFSEFSEWYFLALARLEELGISILKPAVKLLGNSTFGKVGSRGKNWTEIEWKHKRETWAQWWGENPRLKHVTQFRALDGVVSYLDGTNEPPESMPSISATMNSYGRMELWRLMNKAGRENVYYVDTDGLVVNETGYSKLRDEFSDRVPLPGELNLREFGSDVEIFGIKHYRFEERLCCAGVSLDKNQFVDGAILTIQHEPFTYGLWHRNPFFHCYNEIWKKYMGHYKHGYKNSDGRIDPWLVCPVYEGVELNGKSIDESPAYKVVGSKAQFAPQPS